MIEDAAFIKAIIARPGADAPRLAYAAALAARGDPHGALIRAQCALEAQAPGAPQRAALEQEAAALIAAHEAAWLGPLAPTSPRGTIGVASSRNSRCATSRWIRRGWTRWRPCPSWPG